MPKWLLRILSNTTDALVFSQLVYWLERSNKKPNLDRDLQRRWVAKTASDLATELHRSLNEIDHSLRRLRESDLIEWESRKFGGVKQRHISIKWEKVHLAYLKATEGTGS